MKRLRSSIRAKLTVALLVPLMSAIAVCWIIGASIITTRFSSQALQNVSSNLNSAHELFLGDLARLTDVIRLTSQSPEAATALVGQTADSLVAQLQTTFRNEGLAFLTVVDQFGFVRYRVGNPSAHGDSRRGDKLVADALKGVASSGVMVLSAERAERENHRLPAMMSLPIKPTLHARRYTKKMEDRGLFQVAAAPVLTTDGHVQGAIYGGVLLNGDRRLIDRITQVLFQRGEDGRQGSGSATIFLDDVRISTSVLDEGGSPAVGTLMSEEVFASISRGIPWLDTAYVLNARNFTAYEPLRDLRGAVVGALYVGVPEKPLLQLRRQVNLIFSAVLVLVTLIGVALSAWLGANLSRPIRALEVGARRIASGDNLPDIAVETQDEIGSLAREFNAMKSRLRERDEENQSLNRTLEEKVLERTAQLEEKSQQLLNAQKELAQAERLAGIGLLASGVAHEINNPMAIIRGNAELLEMSVRLDDNDRSEVATIIGQVGRVERIVSNLLTFSRSRKKVVRPFILSQVLEDIISQLGHQIPLESYRIERTYEPGMPEIEGDEDQLRQVFTNLIINGLQAMEQGGVMNIFALITAEGHGLVSISDTGPGISPELREKLFTPFFTTKAKGTGLGLAVSYGIVRDHGGDIRVDSEPGQGATFSVLLPLRQVPVATDAHV